MRSPRHPVRVGLKHSPQWTTVAELREVWRIADEAGFDHCWVFDHFATIGGRGTGGPILEGWTLLGAMAEATRRTRIGVMVTGNTYRHPAVLAKMAATVDHLSGGRLEFGLGAAWAEVEHQMLDIPFPRVSERIGRLGEACQVVKLLWTEPRAGFDGRFYRLRDAIAEPKPVQKPHPPIWIGGSGERKTLRVVAEHADVWNTNAGGREEGARVIRVLEEHCAAVGRDPAEIRYSAQYRWDGGDPNRAVEDLLAQVEIGFTELVIIVAGEHPVRVAERAAEHVLPRLR